MQTIGQRIGGTVILGVVLAAASCGGGTTEPAPPITSDNPFTFTITTSGITPAEFTVPAGTRLLFVNNDSRPRNMTSDPHPEHNEPGCEGINNVGALARGQRRETGNMVVVKTCGFHDHDDPDNTRVRGRIVVRP